MSVENGDADRRRSGAPVPAWEQRGGPQGPPPPGYRPPSSTPRHGGGPPPPNVRPGPPLNEQAPRPAPPYRPAPGQPMPAQPSRRPPPFASPAPLSGPAAGIGAPAHGAGNAYSQTTDPADHRNDHYSPAYLDDQVGYQESGTQMTPAPHPRAKNRTNRTAVVALILSVIGVAFPAGIVCGHIARAQIRRSGEQGDSLAIAALWVGYLYLSAFVLVMGGYLYIVGTGS